MPIDSCQHTFQVLAEKVLPGFMTELRTALQQSYGAQKFGAPGEGVGSILKSLGINEDFSGLYVFAENGKPIYVGISRGVVSRIRQHLTGTTHYDATLAFRMAQINSSKTGQRKLLMKDQTFLEHFNQAKKHLSTLSVAWVRIDNPVELYLFEVYAALELDTRLWNTFKTH